MRTRQPALSPDADAFEIVEALWRLPRDIVSDGYDAALRSLADHLPMTVHEYPTGEPCWTWKVPEKWTCHEAWLETMDGRRLFSHDEHPLHVVSYSLPFEGVVTREELFRHLHVHPRLPDAVPFVFKYYERDWGLCCTRVLKDSLEDDQYRVCIRTEFTPGTLKVGEVVVPGTSDESIVLCAHLCHPHQANDDLTGVAVGMRVMRELASRPPGRYTWRFLILPETIGSVAWLSHNEALLPKIAGGLFLEMLGLSNPHALQLSISADTLVDRCFSRVLRRMDSSGWTGAFREVIGNDERQFNSPGVRIPMLSLSRVLPRGSAEHPYREYHSSHDTVERVSRASLDASVEMVLSMVDALEAERVPVNLFKGEIFCSRYGLHTDPYVNREASAAFFRVTDLIDGQHSILDIAERCDLSERKVTGLIDRLVHHGLVAWRD